VAPLPEDLPGGYQFLDDSGGGQFEEAAAISGLAIALLDHFRAQKAQVALEVSQLLRRHSVVWEMGGSLCHEAMLSYSLFVRYSDRKPLKNLLEEVLVA
jgi:hypothetical protein